MKKKHILKVNHILKEKHILEKKQILKKKHILEKGTHFEKDTCCKRNYSGTSEQWSLRSHLAGNIKRLPFSKGVRLIKLLI